MRALMWRGRTLAGLSATLTLAACALLPAAASAGLNPVVGDCYAHTRLTKHYTTQQLQQALNNIPPDIAEYSNCPDVIREQLDQQLGGSGHGGSGGGGGSSFLPVWLIVLIVLIVLGGGGATIAARRRGGGGDQPPPTISL
jgi:hypothetical protein